jgi:hypothetical protein
LGGSLGVCWGKPSDNEERLRANFGLGDILSRCYLSLTHRRVRFHAKRRFYAKRRTRWIINVKVMIIHHWIQDSSTEAICAFET